MRTTITLNDDVAEKARALAASGDRAFKDVINEALRLGLEDLETPAAAGKRGRPVPRDLGLRAGRQLDNIGELLEQVEGAEYR